LSDVTFIQGVVKGNGPHQEMRADVFEARSDWTINERGSRSGLLFQSGDQAPCTNGEIDDRADGPVRSDPEAVGAECTQETDDCV
jgi:hypothetical protein